MQFVNYRFSPCVFSLLSDDKAMPDMKMAAAIINSTLIIPIVIPPYFLFVRSFLKDIYQSRMPL